MSPTSESWNAADHFKISLTEGLFLTYLHFQKGKNNDDNVEILVKDCVRKIYDFYVLFTMNDTMAKKYRTIYNKVQNAGETVEQVICFRYSSPPTLSKTPKSFSLVDKETVSTFSLFSYMELMML